VRVAVDTHALIWFLKVSLRLSEDSRLALRDAQDTDGVRGAFRASFGAYALTRKLKLPSPTDRANVRITRAASSKGPCV
jgi:PIN domain nuclease of toxin-antitoxin system